MSLIYLDSSIVIYLVERHPVYSSLIEGALRNVHDSVPVVSPLVELEVLVRPLQSGNADVVALYRRFLDTTRSLSINDATFRLALDVRVRHRLKTPDALHLAIAGQHGCDFLWTNDDRLSSAAGHLSVNLFRQGE